ncbi:MAG: hypothetical protein AABX04_05185 [Nanoarchaeota archaeon]
MDNVRYFVVPEETIRGYNTLEEAQQATGKGKAIVVPLSGLEEALRDVAPIAEARNAPLTLFLNTAELGRKVVINCFDLNHISSEALKLVPYEVAERYTLIPVDLHQDTHLLAIVIGRESSEAKISLLAEAIYDVAFLSGYHLQVAYAPIEKVTAAIDKHYAADKIRLAAEKDQLAKS